MNGFAALSENEKRLKINHNKQKITYGGEHDRSRKRK